MSFKNIQKDVNDWTRQFKYPYWQPLEILARATEEIGELSRELNHRFGPKKKKNNEQIQEISEKIGDIIFALVRLANSQKIDLDQS